MLLGTFMQTQEGRTKKYDGIVHSCNQGKKKKKKVLAAFKAQTFLSSCFFFFFLHLTVWVALKRTPWQWRQRHRFFFPPLLDEHTSGIYTSGSAPFSLLLYIRHHGQIIPHGRCFLSFLPPFISFKCQYSNFDSIPSAPIFQAVVLALSLHLVGKRDGAKPQRGTLHRKLSFCWVFICDKQY